MEKSPQKIKTTAHRLLGDEVLVVNFKSSFFYNFNQVGTFIWEQCDGTNTVAQIAEALAAEYDVSLEEAVRDCQEFIESLVEQGLLEWKDK